MTWDGRRGNCRSRNYPAKANPNRAPIVQERANDFSGQGDSFPETCDPDCRRNPLTESQQRLAAKYLPMAEAMVLRLRCRDHERDELNSVAYMALVEAAQTFDPTRTVNFATFARLRIRGALQTYRKILLSGASGVQRDANTGVLQAGSLEGEGRLGLRRVPEESGRTRPGGGRCAGVLPAPPPAIPGLRLPVDLS